MSDVLEIRDTKGSDIGRFVRRIRRGHELSLHYKGINIHRELRNNYLASYLCRVAFLKGEPFAIWGCAASILSPWGLVWLVLTELGTKHPLLAIKETRRQLDEMMLTKGALVTLIGDGDEAAFRFATFLGFHVSPDPQGGMAHSRDGRRRLMAYAKANPEFRVPMGTGYGVRMGYQPEASWT